VTSQAKKNRILELLGAPRTKCWCKILIPTNRQYGNK
jgi:hypothetical protein